MKWYQKLYVFPSLLFITCYFNIRDWKDRYFTTAPEGREVPQPNNTRVARFVKNMVGFPV